MKTAAKKIVYGVAFGALIASAIGVSVLSMEIAKNNVPNNTTIEVNGEQSKTMKFDIEGLNPGEQCSYFIDLKSKDDGDYAMKSIIKNQKGELFNYIAMEIKFNNEYLMEKEMLTECLSNPCSFDIELTHGVTKKVEYIFSIDSSFGNDVENLSTSFDCLIEIKKAL